MKSSFYMITPTESEVKVKNSIDWVRNLGLLAFYYK